MIKGVPVIDLHVGFRIPGQHNPVKNCRLLRDEESVGGQWTHPAEYMFREAAANVEAGASPAEVIDLMDELGIEKGMLQLHPEDAVVVLRVIEQYPDRFVGRVHLDPTQGMAAVRHLDDLVRNHGVKAASILPCTIAKPPSDKVYYPIFAKCIELDIPITLNVGIPGPRLPGECQNPIHLDEVCWYWPELKVVMMHGGEPWTFTCAKLMLKWPNLYYMTSAFAPRYYPKDIIDFANTRGADKVMFAGYHPNIHLRRTAKELEEVPLREHVWPKFLRENAKRVFKL